ncbi:hypothetical protein GE21DRAFT_1116757 [Neurospora crassa]|nr:hypothetical protein GE21DRAFT_1116757 [Neurospora crassa]
MNPAYAGQGYRYEDASSYPSTTPATRSKMDKSRDEPKTPHDLSDPCRLSSHCAIIGRATHTAFRLQVPGIYSFPAYTFHSVRRADPELPVASGCSSFHQAERPRAATIRPSQGSILCHDRQPLNRDFVIVLRYTYATGNRVHFSLRSHRSRQWKFSRCFRCRENPALIRVHGDFRSISFKLTSVRDESPGFP